MGLLLRSPAWVALLVLLLALHVGAQDFQEEEGSAGQIQLDKDLWTGVNGPYADDGEPITGNENEQYVHENAGDSEPSRTETDVPAGDEQEQPLIARLFDWLSALRGGFAGKDQSADNDVPGPDLPGPDLPSPDDHGPPGHHPHPPKGPPSTKMQEEAKLIVAKALQEYSATKVNVPGKMTGAECVGNETSYLTANVTAQIEAFCKEESSAGKKKHFCEFAKDRPKLAALATLSVAEIDPVNIAYLRCQVAGPCAPDSDHVLGNLTLVKIVADRAVLPAVGHALHPRPVGPPHRHPHHKRHHRPDHGPPLALAFRSAVRKLLKEEKAECPCKGCMARKLELAKAVAKDTIFNLCHKEHPSPPLKHFCTFARDNKCLAKTVIALHLQPWLLARGSCAAEGFCPGPPHFGPHPGPGPFGPHPGPHPGPPHFGPHPGPDPFGPHPGPDPFGPYPGPDPVGPHPGPDPFGPHPGPDPFGPHSGHPHFGPHQDPGPRHGRPHFGPHTGPGPFGPHPDFWPEPFGPHSGPFGPRPGFRPGSRPPFPGRWRRRFGPHAGPENYNVINLNMVEPRGPLHPGAKRGPKAPHHGPHHGPQKRHHDGPGAWGVEYASDYVQKFESQDQGVDDMGDDFVELT